MSDLADLAFDVAGDLPAQVRKVIDTATVNGWELNQPGLTIALRLNHPTDELAQPVYITWAVSRSPTGRMSFKFFSCGTRGMVQLTGSDLLEYLVDPTITYLTPDDIAEIDAKALKTAQESLPSWDAKKSPTVNLQTVLGASPLSIDKILAQPPKPVSAPKPGAVPLRVKAPALRVQAPKA